ALGHLRARETVHGLVALAHDPSEVVRQALVEALGALGCAGTQPARGKRVGRGRGRGIGWLFGRKKGAPAPLADPTGLAVATLVTALADESVAVRAQSAVALGRIGAPAATAAVGLIALVKDGDETVRCQAAEALGKVG